MTQWDKFTQDSYTVTVYGEHFEQGEPFQSYTVGSKETAKELIQQILRRNHLNLKDPNLFYLTFHIDPRYISTNYELMAVPRFTHGSSDRSGGKSHVGTLYSDAILSRTLDLTKDNRITLHMQPGGMLRVYDNCFSKPPSIRQLYISKTTCSEEVINLVMTIVGSSEPPEDYCLVEEDANDGGRILREKDYPLLVSRTSGHNGVLILRRKDDAFRTDRIRRKPWVTRSRSFSGRHNGSEKTLTEEHFKESDQAEQSQFCRPLNLLPRIFRSLRRSKTMESQKRETSPRPALVNNSVFSTPSSLRQSPRDRSRSPQRTVHYDCEEKAMEESPVNRSLMNPHYRPLSASRTPTSTESRMTIHEFDHTMSNWSLAPSGMISAPLGRTSFRTPPLQVPRRFTSNTIESRRMVAPWTKAPPRPPMPKRAGSHDVDRLQSTTTTNRRSEMVYRPTEPARNQTIYEEQHLHKLNHNEPSEDTIKEQEIEDSLNTTVASNGGSPFDPRRGDDSGLTELERVWARKRMTKIRTVRQTILPEKHKSEHNNHLPVRDYDSPAELTTTGSEESKMRDHVETNGNDGFQNISRKSSSPLAILDLQNMSKLQTLKLTESSIQESNQRNTPSKGSTEFRKVSIEMSQTGAQEQETPPNIVPCQYSASIRPVVTGLRNEHMDHHGSLEKLQRPPISSTKSENVGCEIKGLMIKAVISHEETTVSTENITQTKEAISKDKTDIKQPTDRYSRSLEQRNFLSQEVSLKPTGETSKEPNSNIVAVSTEKMMTLTTHLQTAPDSRAVSMSKLTIALPDIQRPNSTAFNMNEIKIPRPMTTTAVTAPTSTTTTTGTTTTPTPVLMNPGTGRLSALTPMATIVESTTRTTTTTTASKTIKRSPPELMEKPKLHLSNGAIPNQTHVTDLQLIKPQPRPELSYSDGKMNLAVTDRLSASAGGNKVQTVWSSSQTKEPVFETMQRPPYPTLFDILHHCNILRVVLDPNIPSQSKQLGLHLGLSKFPLDDIQRASSIQRLQQQQQQSANTGSKDTLNSVGSESQYGPKGPKPRIRPREGSAFRAVEYRRLEDAPDIVTIERVDPDSPAAIEGGLTAGTLLLEINGKTLLPTADSDDLSTSSIGLLRLAVEQLQAASQAGRLGEAALVRITAARYHNRFGVENKVDTPERISLANRRFIIGKAMNDTELEDQILSWRKTPSSIISSDAASLRSSRRKSDVSLGRTSLASQSEAGTCTPINGSQSEPNSDTSRAQSVDAVGPKDGLVWFPASRVTFKPSPLTMERSTRMMRNAEAWS